MVRPPCRPLPPEKSVPYRTDCFVVSPMVGMDGPCACGGGAATWGEATVGAASRGAALSIFCRWEYHSSNILRICFIWAGVNSASSAHPVVGGIIMRTAMAPAITNNRRIGRPPCCWGLRWSSCLIKGLLWSSNGDLVRVMDSSPVATVRTVLW